MPLEAVMIIVDNSESSRNGDYQPTRFDAQSDAVGVVFQRIIQGNPESEVGLMSMAGKGPEVLVTMTAEQGKIFEGLHRTKKRIRGDAYLVTSLQVALLALRHRKNKTQRTRIISFVCSPVKEDEKTLLSLANKLKKNSVAVDFVLFGDLDEASLSKLRKFNEKVKGNEGSHIVIIPPSGSLLSDQLLATPIVLGEGAIAAGASATGLGIPGGADSGEFNELDFDPSNDPELALALRMSLEEENMRQQKKAREEADKTRRENLDSVPEEGGEASEPLLDASGQPSGSGNKDTKDAKDDDKMDTS